MGPRRAISHSPARYFLRPLTLQPNGCRLTHGSPRILCGGDAELTALEYGQGGYADAKRHQDHLLPSPAAPHPRRAPKVYRPQGSQREIGRRHLWSLPWSQQLTGYLGGLVEHLIGRDCDYWRQGG
jgi:hypothetical protein